MTNLIKYANPQVQIGEYIYVMSPALNYGTPQVGTNFIPPGAYNTADYPELFEKIGYQAGSVYTARTASSTPSTLQVITANYGNGIYLLTTQYDFDLFNPSVIIRSSNGTSWSASYDVGAITAVTYGNGLFVKGYSGGTISTSTDGITWTARTSGTTSQISALTYGNGLYVAAGAGGMLRTSTDGITWDTRTSSTTLAISALTYGNGVYVYGGTGGISTSTDGITWTVRTTSLVPTALTYGNGQYVLATSSGGISTSTNGITWTTRTSGTSSAIYALTYGNGVFVYGGGGTGGVGRRIAISTDNGVTWIERPIDLTSTFWVTALTYGNGLYVYGSRFARLGTSTTSIQIESTGGLYDIATQFYVPNVTALGNLSANNTTLDESYPQNLNYIRAK